ncbi:hypothetical protein B0H10DRAFT_2240160 [Mycena sp. CBHHK59/15]|nr:hypothetical protein B0H10DRAFT_2240160 [Mycena sp. CBHHK59/15]
MSTPVPSTSALFTPLPAPSIHPQSGPPPVACASDHYSGSHECASSSVTLPPPSSSYRLSRSSKIPFFHGGMQSDNLDIPRVSAELAQLVDEHDPTLPAYFAHFFTKTAEHDKQALSNLDAIAKEYSSFPTVNAILLLKWDPAILNRTRAWILNNLIPVALADRLTWVADPETPPPPVQQQEYGQTAHLRKQFRDVMEDWHATLISIDSYVHKKANKAAPKHQPPQQNDLLRHQQIATLNTCSATQPAIANVSTLTYAVQVLLRGNPTISLQSRRQMLEEEMMLEVYPPLVHVFVYHAAAVVCKATICIQPHLLQLVDHWTTRGNLYSMQNNHPISRLDRTTHTSVLPEHPLPPPKFEEDNLYAMPMDSLTPELDIPSPIFSFHSPTSPEPASSPFHPALSPDPTPPGTVIHPYPITKTTTSIYPSTTPPQSNFGVKSHCPHRRSPPRLLGQMLPSSPKNMATPTMTSTCHRLNTHPHHCSPPPPPAPPTGAKRGHLNDNNDDSRHEQQTAQDFPPVKRPRVGDSNPSEDVPEAPAATGAPPAPPLTPSPAADAQGEQSPAHDDAPPAPPAGAVQPADSAPQNAPPAGAAPLAATSAGDVPAADAPPTPPAGAVQPADGASPNAPPAGAAPAAATSAGSQQSAAATTSLDGGPVQTEDTNADGQLVRVRG